MAVRKNLIKLAKKITGPSAIITKIDENSPEYYALDPILSDEEIEVVMALEVRKDLTIPQIAKKCHKTEEETKKLIDVIAEKGVCLKSTLTGEDLYYLPIFVPGIMEMLVANKEQVEKYPQIARAFEEYTLKRTDMLSKNLPMGHSAMRVIPIESSIDGNSKTATFEQISEILKKHDTFSVSACSCRRTRRLMGEGCGHLEDDMCIQLGKAAEFYIKTGRGRSVTREEVLEILHKAEENGLMHQIPNMDGPGETHAICNCCPCSCFSLRMAKYFNTPDIIKSNYVAKVDKEKCVACGQCVENCPTNALKLGQKLCSKNPVADKKPITVRDHAWGKDKYNPDYRDNRVNVMESGTSPCKVECPAHIAVQGYIKLASQGKYMDALELIKKENPFPAICGRICPRACESACTRGDIDNPIAIDEIKKFIADKELNEKTRFVPTKRHEYGKPIAVIGAGPAGLSCAYYLAVDGYNVTVFEKQEKLGGMLTMGIPAFRLEKNVVNAEIDILKELGVKFKTGVDVGKDVTLNELRKQGFKAFYLAIGAQAGRMLNIEGENAEGVITGVDFLRNVSLGKETKLSGNVVVIGGGNVAIDVARTATRVGGENISMFCLESAKEMPALPEEIEEAEKENIAINNGWGPNRVVVENGKVVGVEFKKCVSVFDENGKFSPKYDEKNVKTVKADHVLLSVGQSIDWGNLLDGSKVELNRNKTAKADALTYQTGEKDIFVGGDAFTGPKFAIDAIAAGKEGSISIHRSVWPGQSLTIGRDRRQYHSIDKGNIVVEGYDTTPRQKIGHNAKNEKTFKDTRVTFTEDQIKKETARCLGCGAVNVDEYLCVGCGMCTTKCKFDAIHLEKVRDIKGTTYEKLPARTMKNALKRSNKIVVRKIKDAFTN